MTSPLPAVPIGDGSPNAKIMIVGEAFGESEEQAGKPFVGASGLELNRMLHEVGILRSECYVTNVVNARPPNNDLSAWVPERKSAVTPDCLYIRNRWVKPIVAAGYASLRREIELVQPRLILTLGNTPLQFLAGQRGILKWRGSLLNLDGDPSKPRLIPTIHPAAILRQWDLRAIAIQDLRRAKRELTSPAVPPQWNFTIRPSLKTALSLLSNLKTSLDSDPLWIDFDIETAVGHITCAGISWSRTECLCLPFVVESTRKHYWSTAEDEGRVVHALQSVLCHPNVRVRGQNLLYDSQYTWRFWKFVPRIAQDTMISHHSVWCGMQKSLAFQASLYSEYYLYWKELHKGTELKAGD